MAWRALCSCGERGAPRSGIMLLRSHVSATDRPWGPRGASRRFQNLREGRGAHYERILPHQGGGSMARAEGAGRTCRAPGGADILWPLTARPARSVSLDGRAQQDRITELARSKACTSLSTSSPLRIRWSRCRTTSTPATAADSSSLWYRPPEQRVCRVPVRCRRQSSRLPEGAI